MKRLLTLTFALSMIAAVAAADNGHGSGGFNFGPGGGVIVDANGTIYVSDSVIDRATRSSTTTIKAISSSGSVLWTATVSNAHGPRLSGPNLLFTDTTKASDGTVSTVLTAISTSSGSVAWTQTFNGAVTELDPFSAGTYIVVVTPAATTGGTASRSLMAIDNNGKTLWTVSL